MVFVAIIFFLFCLDDCWEKRSSQRKPTQTQREDANRPLESPPEDLKLQ